MNTEFLFENIILLPLIAFVVIAMYLIQFYSVISPCRIEFDEDSKREMRIMNRYNILSEKAFTIYVSAVMAGIAVAIMMSSTVVLVLLMIAQIFYMILAVALMLIMYDRSKKYWEAYQCKIPSREALTISGM